MRKLIRLTESDLVRLVKRIVKEQELDNELPKKQKGYMGHRGLWYDEDDRHVKDGEFDYDEEIEFGPDDFENFISHTDKDFPKNRWAFNLQGYKGDRKPGKGYWDRYQSGGTVKLRKKKMD